MEYQRTRFLTILTTTWLLRKLDTRCAACLRFITPACSRTGSTAITRIRSQQRRKRPSCARRQRSRSDSLTTGLQTIAEGTFIKKKKKKPKHCTFIRYCYFIGPTLRFSAFSKISHRQQSMPISSSGSRSSRACIAISTSTSITNNININAITIQGLELIATSSSSFRITPVTRQRSTSAAGIGITLLCARMSSAPS